MHAIEPTPPRAEAAGWTREAARRAMLAGAARALAAVLATVAFGLGWAGVETLVAGPGSGGAAHDVPAAASEGGPGPRGAPAPQSPPAPYPERPMEPTAEPPREPRSEDEPRIWLVDGFNVLHAGVLAGRDRAGWWRAESQLRLLRRVARFDPAEAEVWVVFDAAHERSERCEPLAASPRTKLVFAPSADDWLVRRVRQADEPERLAVVTGDRQVQGRVRHAGARVISPRAFLARCPGDDPASASA